MSRTILQWLFTSTERPKKMYRSPKQKFVLTYFGENVYLIIIYNFYI
jgi:hypothetical protein